MLTFGVLYYIFPRIFRTKLYRKSLANVHFWVATLGTLFYAVPLYWAGWTQSAMWKQFTPDGLLQYGNFLETVDAILPMYMLRAFGGTIYLAGVVIMIYNLIKTVKQGDFQANEPASAPPLAASPGGHKGEYWHRWIERRPVQLIIGSTVVILIGGMAEIFPMVMVDDNVPTISSVKPYRPLELQGRDIYIANGRNNCHRQMIRPFRSETERYGQYSVNFLTNNPLFLQASVPVSGPVSGSLFSGMASLEQLLTVLMLLVFVAGMGAVINLSFAFMRMQRVRMLEKYHPEVLEKIGVPVPASVTAPWWKQLYDRLTDDVPLDQEQDILLDHN